MIQMGTMTPESTNSQQFSSKRWVGPASSSRTHEGLFTGTIESDHSYAMFTITMVVSTEEEGV